MNKSFSLGRRTFLTTTAGLAMISKTVLGKNASAPHSPGTLTVQQVIDLILKEIPGTPFANTVDTIKTGNGNQPVTGIVTTMFATIDVVRKAVAAGANFIIAHEPTFYSHSDETVWLDKDPVYTFKRQLLDKHKIVVWRFHDYWHSHRPDGVLMGVLEKLGWEKYYQANNPRLIIHPGITLSDLANLSKKSLGISMVRTIGEQKQICKRIALIPGAAGGKTQIELLSKERPDVLIVGEVHEWETAEYVRDAQAMGTSMSLIVLGHAESEEPGMQWLVSWLTPKIVNVKVTHIPSRNPFEHG
ncbi:MAG: Nif3-like dinuclear metal center hexameric protein [Chryseolinea sp.]